MRVAPVAAPTEFRGTVLSATTVCWQWRDMSYNEEQFIIRNEAELIKELPADTTYWLETGLSPDTSYYRYAEAYNSAGIEVSSGVTVYTLAAEPLSFEVTLSSEEIISVSWHNNANPDWTVYEIVSSSDNFVNVFTTKTIIPPGPPFPKGGISTAAVINLIPDKNYKLKIRAKSVQGIYTEFSAPASTKTVDSVPPAAITQFTATPGQGNGDIQLSWTATGDNGTEGNLTGEFRIFYSTAESEAKASHYDDYKIKISTSNLLPLTSCSRTISGLIPAATYYFCIWSCDEVLNWSGDSTLVSSYAQDLPPEAPAGAVVEVPPYGEKLYLSWNANTESDISEYRIYRSETGGFMAGSGNYLVTKAHPVTIHKDKGLTNGTRYYYKIIAADVRGNTSAESVEVSGIPVEPQYGISGRIDIEGYKSNYKEIAGFESDEFWNPASYDSSDYREGKSALKLTSSNGTLAQSERITQVLDMSVLENIEFWLKVSDAESLSSAKLRLCSDVNGTVYYEYAASALIRGWNFMTVSKSLWTETGNGAWSNIVRVEAEVTSAAGQTVEVSFDDLRAVDIRNGTGGAWGEDSGNWSLSRGTYSQTGAGGVNVLAGYIYKDCTMETNIRFDEEEPGGIVFRYWGEQDGYKVELDPAADKIRLKLLNGMLLDEAAYTIDTDKWYKVKVDNVGTRKEIYIAEAEESYTSDAVCSQNVSEDYAQGRIGIWAEGRVSFSGIKVLAVPESFTGLGLDRKVQLNWEISGSSGIAKYNIYKSSSANWADDVTPLGSSNLLYTVESSMINGSNNWYRITAVADDGYESGWRECGNNPVSPINRYGISGKVTKKDGTQLQGLKVRAVRGGASAAEAWTGPGGAYSLSELTSGATYMVETEWVLDDIMSRVGRDAGTGDDDLDFTLELDVEVGILAGRIMTVSSLAGNKKRSALACLVSSVEEADRQMELSELKEDGKIAYIELSNVKREVAVKAVVEDDGSFEIKNLLPGTYYVRGYDGSRWSSQSKVILEEGAKLLITLSFAGLPENEVYAYPNPCRDNEMVIRYYSGWVNPEGAIRIYTLTGEKVREATTGDFTSGSGVYKFIWDLRNDSRRQVASGVYFYIVDLRDPATGEKKRVIKKLAVVR